MWDKVSFCLYLSNANSDKSMLPYNCALILSLVSIFTAWNRSAQYLLYLNFILCGRIRCCSMISQINTTNKTHEIKIIRSNIFLFSCVLILLSTFIIYICDLLISDPYDHYTFLILVNKFPSHNIMETVQVEPHAFRLDKLCMYICR